MIPMSTGAKAALITGGAAACIAAGSWLSGAAFMALSEHSVKRVPNVKLTSIARYWSEYGHDPKQKRKLGAITAGGYGLTCALLPGLLVAGLAQRRRSLYGDARFANMQEVKGAKLLDGDGIIIGKYKGHFLTFPGQQYIRVVAAPRKGKGRGIVVPNLLNGNWSAIITDYKEELWKLTAGTRAWMGQKVFRFAPFDSKGCTARFNALGYVRSDPVHRIGDLQALGNIIYPDPGGDAKDSTRFFADAARNLFIAMGLFLLETPELPRTFGQMLRTASGNGKPFHTYIEELVKERVKQKRPLSNDCVAAFNRFLANTAQVFSSILSSFTGPLNIFMNPIVDAATSANDFDLDRVRKERMSVYVCIPFENVATSRLLINLLFSTAINLNTRELPEQNPELKHQCVLMLDEFPIAGHIDALATSIGLMPGYDLRVVLICQSDSQVASVYGDKTAQTIATTMALDVILPPKDQGDAEKFSKMLDNCTEKVRNRNFSSGRGGSSSGTSEQQQKRPLMLPQEIKRIGNKRQIIVLEDIPPIFCDRANYDQDPELKRRSEIPAPAVPPLDMDAFLARINQCVRPMAPGEGETTPVPVERMAPNFTELPPLRQEASSEDIDRWADDFLGTAKVSAEAIAALQGEEKPKKKPATKKAAAAKKPAAKKAKEGTADEPPPADDDERWAAAYAAAEDEIDVSAAFKPPSAGNNASA